MTEETTDEIRRAIEADGPERDALAARMGLVAVESLTAEVTLRRLSGGPLFSLRGKIAADVIQSCVVTLEPVPGHVEEDFDELFAAEGYEPPEEDEEAEIPEFFTGSDIDIGELAAQILALSLNPYPRAPGAALEETTDGEENVSDRRRPFEGLAEMLKDRK
jgi:uncharacterized metal-binding protein YceD (DUF177 family)